MREIIPYQGNRSKYVAVTLERLTGLGLEARIVEGYLAE